MRNCLVLVLGFLSNYLFSQIPNFPSYQVPYEGGYEGFYQDFHQVMEEKKLQSCPANEVYVFSVLINPDKKIGFVKELNEEYLAKTKCTYDLIKSVLPYLENWKPAVIDGISQVSKATFVVYSDDLANEIPAGYFPNFTYPVYGEFKDKKNSEHFRKELINKIDTRRFNWYDRFAIIVDFIVNKEGKMEDVKMIKSSGSEEFDRYVIGGFKNIKHRWKPATINGNPIDYRIQFTLTGVTDPE